MNTALLARAIIEANVTTPRTVGSIAEELDVCTGTLNTRFKDEYNVTPMELMEKLRFDMLLDLVKTTKLSAEKLSEKIGYGCTGGVTKLFKKRTGMTIGAYRKSGESK